MLLWVYAKYLLIYTSYHTDYELYFKDRHDITEILLKVVLNALNITYILRNAPTLDYKVHLSKFWTKPLWHWLIVVTLGGKNLTTIIDGLLQIPVLYVT
jgi:hypothetical protein